MEPYGAMCLACLDFVLFVVLAVHTFVIWDGAAALQKVWKL